MKQKLTIICKDDWKPEGAGSYPDPLIYVVEGDPEDPDALRQAVAEKRAAEMGISLHDVLPDLRLLLAYAGELHPVADWRE